MVMLDGCIDKDEQSMVLTGTTPQKSKIKSRQQNDRRTGERAVCGGVGQKYSMGNEGLFKIILCIHFLTCKSHDECQYRVDSAIQYSRDTLSEGA